jgi:predicted nucleic acid-binding protein
VIREASAGDKHAAAKRLAALEDMPLLEVNESAKRLAAALLKAAALPDKATDDALHIALAAAHGTDYLLTWNCKHIANAEIRNIVAAVSYQHGYAAPVICTPEELLSAPYKGVIRAF